MRGEAPSEPAIDSRDAPAAPGPERDDRLDLLRGLFVLLMIVGHLGWRRFDAHFPLGWVTGAEGFFCVSGATLGLVARRLEESGRRGALLRRLRLRAPWLLALNLALVSTAVALEVAPPFTQRALLRRFPDSTAWQRLLSFDHGLALNVLPRYALFVLAAPAVLWLLRRRRGGALVLALSGALWAANFVSGKRLLVPLLEWPRSDFAVASWQLLFFGGLVLAWSFPPLVARPGGDSKRRTVLLGVAGALVAGFALWQARVPGGANTTAGALGWWFERGTLGPLRLVNFVVDGAFLWLAVDRWRARLVRWLGWILLPLGRNALAAFVLHLPLLWLGASIRPSSEPAQLRLWLACGAALAISQVVRWSWVRRALMPV